MGALSLLSLLAVYPTIAHISILLRGHVFTVSVFRRSHFFDESDLSTQDSSFSSDSTGYDYMPRGCRTCACLGIYPCSGGSRNCSRMRSAWRKRKVNLLSARFPRRPNGGMCERLPTAVCRRSRGGNLAGSDAVPALSGVRTVQRIRYNYNSGPLPVLFCPYLATDERKIGRLRSALNIGLRGLRSICAALVSLACGFSLLSLGSAASAHLVGVYPLSFPRHMSFLIPTIFIPSAHLIARYVERFNLSVPLVACVVGANFFTRSVAHSSRSIRTFQ